MKQEVIKKRIKAIRHQLSQKNINCLIVTEPANVTYTTAFLGDDSWAVITSRSLYLITDSRYTEQAAKECSNCKIIERTGPMAQAVAKLIKKTRPKKVAVESSTSVNAFEALKKNITGQLKTISGIIETVRSIKDSTEIAAIKKAAKIANEALDKTLKFIKPGITESELAGQLDFQLRKLASINSFDTIVAFGPNGSRPHHKPTSRVLKKNDCLLIDFGAKYKGYCSDLTRCFAVGKPTKFFNKVYDTVQRAQTAAIKMVKAGTDITKVDAAARKVIAETNLPIYGHGTGHGLGLEVHELPVVSPNSKTKLKAGQIITIEPGIYIPGKLGIRIEDDILVTKTGYKILSNNRK